MTERASNFLIGLISALALIGLSAMLMSFGELEFLFKNRYEVAIHTTNAGGLRDGSAVEFHGVPIGIVESVTTQPDPKWPVRINISIERDVPVPANVEPVANMALIGATAVLELRLSATPSTINLPVDGTAEIVAPMGGGMFAIITEQLEARMEPLMESLERFNKLSDSFVTLGENLNEMLIEQSSSDIEGGTQPNLRTAIVRLNLVLDQAHEGLTLANSFLGDEQLQTDARAAVTKAGQLIEQATKAVDRYVLLADELKTDADDLTKRLLPVMDTLGVTLEEVRRLTRTANEGQGTLGQLLNNPDLYKSLSDAAARLDRTLIELQALIEQLKAEGVIIQF